jgi:hypothetical protein
MRVHLPRRALTYIGIEDRIVGNNGIVGSFAILCSSMVQSQPENAQGPGGDFGDPAQYRCLTFPDEPFSPRRPSF